MKKKPLPTDISIIVTYRCPMRCKMCAIWQNPSDQLREITPAQIYTLPIFKFINITGGEPFIREDLEDLVAAACSRSKRVIISTSGWFDDRAEALARRFPSIGIRISLEGLADTNDYLRGREGGFERAIKLISTLKSIGMKDLGIAYTASDRNSDDLLPLYNLSQQLGIQFATAAVHNSFYFHTSSNKITEPTAICNNFKKLIDLQLREHSIKSHFRAYFNMGLINYIKGNKRYIPCEAGTSNIFIDPYGDIYPCNGVEENLQSMLMGNIRNNTDFCDIWNSEQAEAVRNRVSRCPKNCWMMGTASPVMKKYLHLPLKWVITNKLRSIRGLNSIVVNKQKANNESSSHRN